MPTNKQTMNLASIQCWPATGHRACRGVQLIPRDSPLERTDFPPRQVPTANSFSARVGLCALPILRAGILSKPVQASCMLSQSLRSHKCHSWFCLFPRSHPPPLALTAFLQPLLHRSLSLEGRGEMPAWHLRLSSLSTVSACGCLC